MLMDMLDDDDKVVSAALATFAHDMAANTVAAHLHIVDNLFMVMMD